jgi:predicted dehydrogenase
MKSRRHFLKSATAASLAAGLPLTARPAPSERITVGVIGCGARGFANLRGLLKEADAQVVAVCDVDTFHYREHTSRTGKPLGTEPGKAFVEADYAKEKSSGTYKGCDAYADYRELCARDDIDAILVATPDHWHALMTLEALRNGKDVYCEKPVTHTFGEGQAVVAEVVKQNAIFQTGSQQRSGKEFRRAVEIVRNGLIGKISRVEVGLPVGYPGPMGSNKPEDPPAQQDYERWTGPAQMMPYMRARNHRWWRGHRNYGGGNIMDFIGHHNDINHWALDQDKEGGPLSVEAKGWTDPKGDCYNCPVDYEILCEYPGDITVSIASRHEGGIKWIGEDGSWIWVNRGQTKASEGKKALWADDFDPGPIKVTRSDDHHRNFLDGIKTRTECVAPAHAAHRSITPGHLGYLSNDLGRPLRWDSETETVVGDAQADKLLKTTTYRKEWA